MVQVDVALESRKKLEWSLLSLTQHIKKNGRLSQERQSRGLVHFYQAHGSSIPFRSFILTRPVDYNDCPGCNWLT